jgi:hypothetical protein
MYKQKRFVSSFAASCALAILMSLTGCADTPNAPLGAAEEQMLMDLEKRHAAGTITKDEYDRQRADIHSRAQRESLESGSSLNTTIRGMGVRP